MFDGIAAYDGLELCDDWVWAVFEVVVEERELETQGGSRFTGNAVCAVSYTT